MGFGLGTVYPVFRTYMDFLAAGLEPEPAPPLKGGGLLYFRKPKHLTVEAACFFLHSFGNGDLGMVQIQDFHQLRGHFFFVVQDLAQNGLQDSAVAVVLDIHNAVEADDDVKFDGCVVRLGGAYF